MHQKTRNAPALAFFAKFINQVGKLAFRVAHGGVILKWLHSPLMAALLSGGLGVMLFVGAKQRRRRRDRRRPASERGNRQLEPLRTAGDAHSIYDTYERSIFTTCAVVTLAFVALAALAALYDPRALMIAAPRC